VDNYIPLHRHNRSEAPTSVALAMLLAEPGLGQSLLRTLATTLSWTMWRWTDGEATQEKLVVPEINLEASALFFPIRDVKLPSSVLLETLWRGEIDVVAVMPGHAVIGIELKVLSKTIKLPAQMDGQIEGLKLLAIIYDCPFVAQIALSPTFPWNLSPRVNRLSFVQLRHAVDQLGAAIAPTRDVLAIVARQIDHVLDLTKLPVDSDVCYVTLDELRRMGGDQAHASKWVGVIEGIEKLKVYSRPRWKVAKERLGDNWYPLPDVTRRIEMLTLE
jgi:hypothetical protein